MEPEVPRSIRGGGTNDISQALKQRRRQCGLALFVRRHGRIFPVKHNIFRFFIVDLSQLGACIAAAYQEFVELGVKSLGVAVRRALNKNCHPPSGERGDPTPVQSFGRFEMPNEAIKDDQCQSYRVACERSKLGHEGSQHAGSSFASDANALILKL